MRLYDGKKVVNIEMRVWNGNGYDPDWSEDFFEAGCLVYNEMVNVYYVFDVNYCIDAANEWADEDDNNYVFVEEEELWVS